MWFIEELINQLNIPQKAIDAYLETGLIKLRYYISSDRKHCYVPGINDKDMKKLKEFYKKNWRPE